MDSLLLANKGLFVKGSLALSGVFGASAGSWYAYDSFNPKGTLWFKQKGYTLSPKNLNELQTVSAGDLTNLTRKVNSCFKGFFNNIDGDAIEFINDNSWDDTFISPKSSKFSEIKGCTMMRYSTTSPKDKDKWVFESETVIKNENIGISVWVEADNTKDFPKYSILFLEKENGVWKIKWGFSSLSSPKDVANKEIKSPDGSIKENYLTNTIDSTVLTFKNHQYYSGIWEEDKSGKNELFENVFQFVDKTKFDSENESIFNTFALFKDSGGEKISSKISTKSITGKVLQPWYKPFSGKKGKWITFNDYCSKESEKRINSEREKELINICYIKNPSP